MKTFKNTLLYFSAFVPMYFLIVVKFILGFSSGTIQIEFLTIFMLCIYFLLTVSGIFGLLWNVVWNKDKPEEVKITHTKNITDRHFFGYFSIFVLFALTFELTKWSMAVASLFIIIFIGIVYVNNKMFFINPFLNIIGFSFYEIKYIKKGDEKECSATVFCKGEMVLNKSCFVKLKNANFAFLDKSKS